MGAVVSLLAIRMGLWMSDRWEMKTIRAAKEQRLNREANNVLSKLTEEDINKMLGSREELIGLCYKEKRRREDK